MKLRALPVGGVLRACTPSSSLSLLAISSGSLNSCAARFSTSPPKNPEGLGFRNWYDALFGNIKIDVFAPTSLFFIKFQSEKEINALGSWNVLTDEKGGGVSKASFHLESCNSSDAQEDAYSDETAPDIFQVEPLEEKPPVFKRYARFSGTVSPIPENALWNRDADPNRFGYCALASPAVQNAFPTQNFNVVEIRLRTSLRSFLINFRPEEESTSRFQSLVRVPEHNEWHTIAIPYDAFQLTTRGRVRQVDWGLADDTVHGVTITVRSGDAIPWGDNAKVIESQDFWFDLQWIRFVRRSQGVSEGLSQRISKVTAKEDYAEYLLIWKQRTEILVASGLIRDSTDVAGFSIEQMLEIESSDDVEDIRIQIEHEGIEKPLTGTWSELSDADLLEVEEQLGIPNLKTVWESQNNKNATSE